MTSVTVMVGIFSVLSALLLVCLCVGKEEPMPHVLNYSGDQFKEAIKENPHFVMFHAPWCGHSRRLYPTWDQLAEKYNKPEGSASHEVKIAKVDCTVERQTCRSEGIGGYPKLRFFKVGGETKNMIYTGKLDLGSYERFVEAQMEEIEEAYAETEIPPVPTNPTVVEDTEQSFSNFTGEVQDFINFNASGSYCEDCQASNETEIPPVPTNGLVELTEQSFLDFTGKGQHFINFYDPSCVYCQRLTPIWESLAKSFEYDKNMNIVKLDCTQHRTVCDEMEVKGYPTLLWVKDGRKVKEYQGSRTHDAMKRFIHQNEQC